MEKFTRNRIVLLIIALVALSSTVALGGDILFQNAAGIDVPGVRCGAPIQTPEQTQLNAQQVEAWLKVHEIQ